MVRAMHGVIRAGSLLADRYRLDCPIGRGAMGIVWRGRDELLERDVAVKEVRVPAMVTPDDAGIIYQRTLREAKTAARLNHPAVATVFDVFDQDGSPWIVMELVRARALDQVITEDGPLRPPAAARVGECLLSALTSAHAAGVLHRDVKPSNVLLGQDGRGVLTDFGIATFEGDPGLTQVGMVVGTPGFTAPERLRGQPATQAADLWSLGATLYAAVEGRGPFERPGGPAAIMAGVVSEDAPRAPSAGPLRPVIEALLSADPAARPDAATAARLLAGAAASARAGGTVPGYPWPYGGAAGEAPAVSGATTAACPIPPSPLMPDGIGAFMTAGASPAAEARTGAGYPLGLADLPGPGNAPGAPGSDGLLGSAAPPGPAGLAGSAGPPGSVGLLSSAGLPAFLDVPAFPGGPALPDVPPFPSGPAFAALSQAAGQDPGPPSAGRVPPPPQALLPRSGQGRAFAAALAAIVVLVVGLLGGLAYARSAGGPAAPRGAAGFRQGTNGEVAGHAGAASPASANHGGASPGSVNAGTAAQAAAAGPGQTGVAAPTPASSPGPAASSPATARLPAGYRWYTVSGASSGATAGFTIAVPDAWQASTQGLVTYLTSPSGSTRAEVSLTPFTRPDPVREARLQRREAIRQGRYPGYAGIIVPGTFRGAADAWWRFGYRQPAGRVAVLDLLVSLATSAGAQPYALSMSAPRPGAPAAAQVFQKMLQTFQPAP